MAAAVFGVPPVRHERLLAAAVFSEDSPSVPVLPENLRASSMHAHHIEPERISWHTVGMAGAPQNLRNAAMRTISAAMPAAAAYPTPLLQAVTGIRFRADGFPNHMSDTGRMVSGSTAIEYKCLMLTVGVVPADGPAVGERTDLHMLINNNGPAQLVDVVAATIFSLTMDRETPNTEPHVWGAIILYFGVHHLCQGHGVGLDMFRYVLERVQEHHIIHPGGNIIVLSGLPVDDEPSEMPTNWWQRRFAETGVSYTICRSNHEFIQAAAHAPTRRVPSGVWLPWRLGYGVNDVTALVFEMSTTNLSNASDVYGA